MREFSEVLVDLAERMRRRPRAYWTVRAIMLVCGLAAQGWIAAVGGAGGWNVAGFLAVTLGVVFPRTVVPLLTAAMLVLEAAVLNLNVFALVPVAVALLGWHVSATVLSIGRPWTRRAPSVIAGLRMPVVAALSAIAAAALAAWIAAGVPAPDAGVGTLLIALVVVLGALIVLWPATDARK